MILKKELEDGRIEVSSDKGLVDLNGDPARKIICTEDELEYITEVDSD